MKQETFKKGQTIKLIDGIIALVLNDGLNEREFEKRYNGQEVKFQASTGENLSFIFEGKMKFPGHVWYYILIGDEKVWMINNALQYRKYGKWPSRYRE